ncbi:heavy-metal-associated domain-containing protein [Paraliobacillus sp. JSM ZJ581]|uniref:heavy-metal-associated domain-containing protein n=1 Tax=Paraliobacillus sp. JSM ZJ581 TaxID=3342118 RepID=UPI0035A87BE4
MKKITLEIKGMNCGRCVNKIETALKEQHGVEEATINLKKGTADITYNETILTLDEIIDVVNKVGYKATSINE